MSDFDIGFMNNDLISSSLEDNNNELGSYLILPEDDNQNEFQVNNNENGTSSDPITPTTDIEPTLSSTYSIQGLSGENDNRNISSIFFDTNFNHDSSSFKSNLEQIDRLDYYNNRLNDSLNQSPREEYVDYNVPVSPMFSNNFNTTPEGTDTAPSLNQDMDNINELQNNVNCQLQDVVISQPPQLHVDESSLPQNDNNNINNVNLNDNVEEDEEDDDGEYVEENVDDDSPIREERTRGARREPTTYGRMKLYGEEERCFRCLNILDKNLLFLYNDNRARYCRGRYICLKCSIDVENIRHLRDWETSPSSNFKKCYRCNCKRSIRRFNEGKKLCSYCILKKKYVYQQKIRNH